jgi:hypothetical protein
MVHQRSRTLQVQEHEEGGYGGGGPNPCDNVTGIVHSTITIMDPRMYGTPVASVVIRDAVLPVDVAVSDSGMHVAIAAAGNAKVPGASQVLEFQTDTFRTDASNIASVDTFGGLAMDDSAACAAATVPRPFGPTGQVTAVAYDRDDDIVAQTREPAALWISNDPEPIVLSTVSREDTGLALFHGNAGAGIACASCHPEGGDDGHTWQFDGEGLRRTPMLRGGILGTEPFHWQGDMPDFSHIVTTVFGHRMAGGTLQPDQSAAMQRWVDSIPAAHTSPSPDTASIARGQALFADPSVGCTNCHVGPHLTNNATVDVGTGGSFQVPNLHGVAWRAPYFHDGCAPTLRDRFTSSCGGGDRHGHTSQLSSSQIGDLVAYLETL